MSTDLRYKLQVVKKQGKVRAAACVVWPVKYQQLSMAERKTLPVLL